MSLSLNTLQPVLVQWAFNTTGIVTFWANQKHIRPPMYPYNILEVLSFSSEVGSSAPDLIYNTKVGTKTVRCRESYKLLVVNLQSLAGEVTEASVNALDVLSDALAGLKDAAEKRKFSTARMIPISWEPLVNLTAIQHNEFLSRASTDVMFRVSDTVTETFDPTESISVESTIGENTPRTIVVINPNS
jgi:hypothetical protein